MRVLHLIHSFPPESRGGIESHLERLAAAQVARGDGVRVLAGSEGLRGAEVAVEVAERDGVRVERFAVETELERFADGARRGRAAFAAALDSEAPDLVHVHHFAATGPGVVADAVARGIPTVVTLHDLHTVCPLFFRLRREAELCAPEVTPETCVACLAEETGAPAVALAPAFAGRAEAFAADLRAARAVLAVSRTQLDYLRRVPLLERVALSTIGLPAAPEPADGPLPPRLPDLPLQVATWGGLVRGKGLHLLVEAARRLAPEAVEIHHHGRIVDAAYRDAVLAAAGHVDVHFHGPYEPSDLRARLTGIDLAVHPSLFLETHGLVTDEALRLGLPVVVPDRGAPQERIGARGVTFRAGDAADLARVLERFVERPERLLGLRGGAPGPLLDESEWLVRLDAVYAAALGRDALGSDAR